MPSPQHIAYRKHVQEWSREHAHEPDVPEVLQRYAEPVLVLWHMDLESARPFLMQGYADNPRGSQPWDPITILRCLLLSLLVGQPRTNKWIADLKSSRVLQMLSGVFLDPKDGVPGVGTIYDFFHRLHDGASRRPCPHGERPSVTERRRAKAPRRTKTKRKPHRQEALAENKRRKKLRRKNNCTVDSRVTAKLIDELKAYQNQPNPMDLLGRLSQVLLEVGVRESARRGLLGDINELIVCGDGSPLPTGANRHGKRTCDCSKQPPCDCERVFSDPDANIGYDSHRDLYFFGHHLYEYVASVKGHDLPLALRLDPGSTSDFIASLKSLEHMRKLFRDHSDLKLGAVVYDAGHDGRPNYQFALHHDITPVIPLKTPAAGQHPKRPDIKLSRRGVPLCPAGVEMHRRGENGKGGQIFGCPVKARKLDRCPNAPEGTTCFSCQPRKELGHTVVIKTTDNERLFPPIPRNHRKHRALMNLRSGCERSFSVKKERFKLLQARHRRASFWLIRVHLMAMLQHAMAWVAKEDAQRLVDHLLGRDSESVAA